MKKPKKIDLAEQFQIADLEDTAAISFQDILGMDYSEILVTDESALSDFVGCGDSCDDFPPELNNDALPDTERYARWHDWIRGKVSKQYGVEIPEAGGVYLVALFWEIEAAKKARTQ
ncbi:MAG TPA: hypothetical protein VMT20_00510 [Terriglobia bacterium]|nr:hypothetical protein [Terriglobia bacterium]